MTVFRLALKQEVSIVKSVEAQGENLLLSVCDSITDDTLEEGLENTSCLLVDHGGDTLDTTTTSETSDSGLGDTLDVVTKNLSVALGTALSETLATFAASSHVDRGLKLKALKIDGIEKMEWMRIGRLVMVG